MPVIWYSRPLKQFLPFNKFFFATLTQSHFESITDMTSSLPDPTSSWDLTYPSSCPILLIDCSGLACCVSDPLWSRLLLTSPITWPPPSYDVTSHLTSPAALLIDWTALSLAPSPLRLPPIRITGSPEDRPSSSPSGQHDGRGTTGFSVRRLVMAQEWIYDINVINIVPGSEFAILVFLCDVYCHFSLSYAISVIADCK